jgi:predicted AAA+ superfamily ATPase
MEIIKRETYLKQIRPYFNQPLIKVLTGQRRVGKSYILKQVHQELKEVNPEGHFIFIDFERMEFDSIKTYQELHNFIKQKSIANQNYLLIDEIQQVDGFEKTLRSLLSEGNYDIYITGSNSNLVSGEMATFLSGRQIEIKVYSLSFKEFLQFNQLEPNSISLQRYLKHGGLPYIKNLPNDDEVIMDYLKNIYATILYRDVVSRNQIRDIPFLENLVRFLADNTGSLVSANSIAGFIKSQRQSKSVSIIIGYLNYLCQAYFVTKVLRQEIKGKRVFETSEKYYFQDLGLRNTLTGFDANDVSKVIENAVYNHLIACGYKVRIGKLGEKEIDFVAEKNGEYSYYQATYLLGHEKVIEREFGNLLSINDNYPKYVVSMDDFPVTSSYQGIKQIKLLDFLMSPE